MTDDILAAQWGNITGTLANQTDLMTALNGKQDTIADLNTIRSGAAAGATAVQPADIANMVTDVTVNGSSVVSSGVAAINLTPYALTSSLANVATSGSYNDLINKPTIPTALPVETLTTAPEAAYAGPGLKVVYLSSEPATKYSGYIYMIAEA